MIENPTKNYWPCHCFRRGCCRDYLWRGQEKFLDMPSLLLVAIIGVGNVIGAKGDDSILTKFGDGCVRGAWIGFLIGLILIADAQIFASMNVPALGAAMSVCMLPLFYGYTLKFLSMHLD